MTKSEDVVALRCTDIVKSFPAQKDLRVWRILFGAEFQGHEMLAIDKISMSVQRGKIVGILGKNGAGKSTLLRILGGVYAPTSGCVEVFGKIGGLFELGGTGGRGLTGLEYANRYLDTMGVPEREKIGLLDDIADFSELGEALGHRIQTYSTGMQARLYFSVATALQHEIYLIDELLSVGDEHFVAKCWRRMGQRLLNGASGVLVTHDWQSVLKLCEYSHVMERGKFEFSGRSDEAVISYLNIQVPDADLARFSPDNPGNYVVRCGENVDLRFLVDVLDAVPVEFAISIEMLRIGIGWEIVLLKDQIPVASQPGSYALEVSIPAFPLAPGEYTLNLFLSQPKLNPFDESIGYDIRSWTTGNGYQLTVEGEPSNTLVKLPYVARKTGTGV